MNNILIVVLDSSGDIIGNVTARHPGQFKSHGKWNQRMKKNNSLIRLKNSWWAQGPGPGTQFCSLVLLSFVVVTPMRAKYFQWNHRKCTQFIQFSGKKLFNFFLFSTFLGAELLYESLCPYVFLFFCILLKTLYSTTYTFYRYTHKICLN